MIADRDTAEALLQHINAASESLMRGLRLVEERCPPPEIERCRSAIGDALGSVGFPMLGALFDFHPDLAPPDWFEDDGDPRESESVEARRIERVRRRQEDIPPEEDFAAIAEDHAEAIALVCQRVEETLYDSLTAMAGRLRQRETYAYRIGIGHAMEALNESILRPIQQAHPDLKPVGWREVPSATALVGRDAATVIDLARDFGRHPAGRFREDGPLSAETLREDWLLPGLERGALVVRLDGTGGYAASFLDEAFGGLIRSGRWTLPALKQRLAIEAKAEVYESYVRQAWRLMAEASALASRPVAGQSSAPR